MPGRMPAGFSSTWAARHPGPACPAPGWRPCGRSWFRTTTGTPPGACAGAMMRPTPACRRPPSRIVSPYDLAAPATPAGARSTRWTGYLGPRDRGPAPKTGPTSSPTSPPCPPPATNRQALAGIHSRLERRGPASPASTWQTAATPPWCTWSGPGREHRVALTGPLPGNRTRQQPSPRRATPRRRLPRPATDRPRSPPVPRGQVSKGWARPPTPTSLARRRPAHRGRAFTKGQCQPLPRSGPACTTSGDGKAHRGLSPRAELYELAGPQPRPTSKTPPWHKRYAVRSGVEGTVCELARGPRHAPLPLPGTAQGPPAACPDRHRGQHRTPSASSHPAMSTSPRPPTAFQDYLDQHDIQRLPLMASRQLSHSDQDSRQSQA